MNKILTKHIKHIIIASIKYYHCALPSIKEGLIGMYMYMVVGHGIFVGLKSNYIA